MKKIFIIHGFEGEPNGGWRPWLMRELAKEDVYACSLSMPDPYKPIREEWIEEIKRHVDRNIDDEIYLVGHSLGVPAVLHYLSDKNSKNISGCVLVSGPVNYLDRDELKDFIGSEFDFKNIKEKAGRVAIVHGDDDPAVPFKHAEILKDNLNGELITVKNGKHLNGSAGFTELPELLEVLKKIMV